MSNDPMKWHFTSEVVPSKGPKGAVWWYAKYPDLPGCTAEAPSLAEALQVLDTSRRAYISYLLDSNLPVPKPTAVQPAAVTASVMAPPKAMRWDSMIMTGLMSVTR